MSAIRFYLFLPLSLFLFAALAPTVHLMNFSLPGLPIICGKQNGICLQGNASLGGGGIIELTANQSDKDVNGSVGWAFYTTPLLLWDNSTRELTNFFTKFSFTITKRSASMGDGMAFFLSASPYTVPTTSGGGNLGLMSSQKNGNTTGLVAVEFDTFRNDWDPDSPHIGIDINSLKSSVNMSICTSNDVGDISGTATVSYDAITQNLSVLFEKQGGVVSVSQIVDLREVLPTEVVVGFSAATGDFSEYHSVERWVFSSTLDDLIAERNRAAARATSPGPSPSVPLSNITAQKEGKRNRVGLVVGISVGVGLTMVVAVVVLFGVLRRKKRPVATVSEIKLGRGTSAHIEIQDPIVEDLENNRGPRPFRYEQLAAATDNFSDEKKLGVGGFGAVYKGCLPELNQQVAIKRLSRGSKQGIKEYASEVKIISRLRHKNLVGLVGWCHELSELLLVYEFMSNGSLEDHLFAGDQPLSWPTRYNIALGLASALLYLHTEWDQCVVHRDIKSSNVMLDDNYNAKLGDFGLSRLIDHGSDMKTTVVAGTLGYMAPECLLTGRSSKESDVFSFGVVLLEIACGVRPIEPTAEQEKARLLNWVWSLYERDQVLQAADHRLKGAFDRAQMERVMVVGMWCANPDLNARPSMRQAMAALSFEVTDMVAPPRQMPMPIYFCSRTTTMVAESSPESLAGITSSSYSAIPRDFTTGTDYSSTVSAKSASSSTSFL